MTAARLRRFFATPKGLLIAILAVLASFGIRHEDAAVAAPGVAGAVAVAAVLDAVIMRARRSRWQFPDGAIITALLVAMVLSAQQPWQYPAVTTAIAIVSKYVFRSRAGNVFNPAAFGIVATFYIFNTGQSWWGALPALAPLPQLAMVGTGIFIADRVNKMPLVVAFLGAFYVLFTATAFVAPPARVAEVFRTPDLQAALFFALFILSDPPTSPVEYPDQIVFGAIVAAVSYAVFMWIGAAYYLLAGVLVANVWESWRRVSRRFGYSFPHATGAFLREVSPWRPTHSIALRSTMMLRPCTTTDARISRPSSSTSTMS